MALTQKRLTLEEFLELPEVKPALEFDRGVVTQKVSPQGQHGALGFDVAAILDHCGRPGRLARVFVELRFTSGGRSLVPDVSAYRWERVPRTEDGKIADEFLEPPDIAVEIVSPDQSLREQTAKCAGYVRHGTSIALLVNPRNETVGDFRPGAAPRWLRGDDEIDVGDVIPGCRFSVKDLFATLSE
jgi:Uma2 family endonuclease